MRAVDRRRVQALLRDLKAGKVTVGEAMDALRDLPYQDLGFAKLDSHRDLRRGYPEVILCLGKTPGRIVEIAQRMSESHDLVLATRATRSVYQRLKKALDGKRVTYHEGAAIVSIGTPPKADRGPVLVVTAGTSDIPVAEEAGVTAELMGCKVTRLYDVGVAGVHRVIDQRSCYAGRRSSSWSQGWRAPCRASSRVSSTCPSSPCQRRSGTARASTGWPRSWE